jgi:hypothetical protein
LAKVSIVIGLLLTVLGCVAFFGWQQFGAEHQSVTALIPAFVGVPLIVLGLITVSMPHLRRHTMHAAAALGVLGFFASAGRFAMKPASPATIGGFSTLTMALLCLIFVILCVRSFITIQRARRAGASV